MKQYFSLLIHFLIIGGISYGAYIASTNYLTTGSAFHSQLTLVMCDEVDKVENNMGLSETYKDGKPYSGYVIILKNVMENGSFFYDVWEYRDGGLLNNRHFKSVDSSGEPVQYNPRYLKETINCPFEDETQTNNKDEAKQVIEDNRTTEEAETKEKEEDNPIKDIQNINTDIKLINDEFKGEADCYIINVKAVRTQEEARGEVNNLKDKGLGAGFLWIPDFPSLSGAKYYSVFVGPFATQEECEKETEEYREIQPNAIGLLVSKHNKRVEIRGKGKIKTIPIQEGLVNVSNLNFRSFPVIKNNIIGRLDKGDRVIILDKLSVVLDENIKGLLTNSISVAIDGVITKINKGKSLNILNQDGDSIICEVDLGKTDLSEIVVSSKDVEILNNEAWVKIQHNETIGFVYARFIDE